jgi:hypothetical protein
MLKRAGFDVLGQPAGDAYLSSGSVTLSHCRRLAELHGWTA